MLRKKVLRFRVDSTFITRNERETIYSWFLHLNSSHTFIILCGSKDTTDMAYGGPQRTVPWLRGVSLATPFPLMNESSWKIDKSLLSAQPTRRGKMRAPSGHRMCNGITVKFAVSIILSTVSVLRMTNQSSDCRLSTLLFGTFWIIFKGSSSAVSLSTCCRIWLTFRSCSFIVFQEMLHFCGQNVCMVLLCK